MRKLEELLMTRQFYLRKITEVSSAVIHNRDTKRKLRYYNKAVKELENQVKEELYNESK